jgi:isochorismate hydrolase
VFFKKIIYLCTQIETYFLTKRHNGATQDKTKNQQIFLSLQNNIHIGNLYANVCCVFQTIQQYLKVIKNFWINNVLFVSLKQNFYYLCTSIFFE